MKKLLLFIVLLTSFLLPQLKEMEVKPTENRGGIPIFRDHPDKAAMIFYTQFDNLTFYSSYGIVETTGDQKGGKYILIIEPTRQAIEVRCSGFKTEIIKLGDIQPRDVLYYEVLPKEQEGVVGITELAVTIQATPQDASISIDGTPIKNDSPTKLSIGSHILRVEKSGYTPHNQEITVSPNSTFFKISLTANDPVSVIIGSLPAGAEIFIEGISKGKTEKAMFLYPGSYELRVTLSGYLPVSEKITVSKDEDKNKFTYNLKKNTGKLKFDVEPTIATVKLNKEPVNKSEIHELAPGTYQIEAEAETYYPYKGTVEITLGQTKTEKITLTQKTGKLQFSINPYQAECVLSQNGVEKYKWTGLKIYNTITVGVYDFSAKTSGFKTYTGKITIKENQTTIEDIQMTQGSDSPEGMIWVEGGTFTMGSNEGKSDEKPIHDVTVGSFLIGKYEVTQEQWESVMGGNPSYFKGSKRPVEMVSWYDVVEFCNKLSEKEGLQKAYSGSGSSIICDFNANGYRLPTEAEWEYAARGGNQSKGYKYSGSNEIDRVAWYNGNSGSTTHEVGKKKPNELGIYDMNGNIWERCWDWDGNYSSGSQTNPRGANAGSNRLIRGGGWGYDAVYCRVAHRYRYDLDSRVNNFGFRLVRTK